MATLSMSIAELIDHEISHLHHLLDSVPFGPRTDTKYFFLDVYKLTYGNVKALNLTEAVWEQKHPVAANKLLKLGISFGNLIRSLQNEQTAVEEKQANLKKGGRIQLVDPFGEGYDAKKDLPFAAHHIKFAKNLSHILKNFDIGVVHNVRPSRNSRSGVALESDTTSGNGSSVLSGHMASPIKLNSRQLLIEKLEINIKLDTLFTFKIVLRLLVRIFSILQELMELYNFDKYNDLNTLHGDCDSSLIFSYNSNFSGPVPETVTSPEDYLRLVKQTTSCINAGLVGPFTKMLLSEIVEPRVTNGFQSLLASI